MPLQEGSAWWDVFTLLESMIPMLGLSFLPTSREKSPLAACLVDVKDSVHDVSK